MYVSAMVAPQEVRQVSRTSRLLRAAVVAASVALMVSGCTKFLEGKPMSVSADPYQVAGMPATNGPSGLRLGASGPTPPVQNSDGGEVDHLAAMSVADIEEFWSGAYGAPLNGKFTPVSGLFSWDSNDTSPRTTFCGGSTSGFINAAWCDYAGENCPSRESAPCSSSKNTIGWDRGRLFPDERNAFGDMAIAMVLSHEYGHAIQFTMARLVLHGGLVAEQQADCFAGVYLRWVAEGKSPRFMLSTGDGLNTVLAAMIGVRDPLDIEEDPLYQHGSAFERVSAFQLGFTDGASACAGIDDREILQRRGNLPVTLQQAATGEWPVTEDSVKSVVGALITMFSPATPPTLSFDQQPCPDARPSPPASYCPSTNTIAVDLPGLVKMSTSLSRLIGVRTLTLPLFGDYTAYSVLASRFMLSIQQQHGGLSLNNAEAGLRTACLTGVATTKLSNGVKVASGHTITLTAGDLDEAVSGLLTNGLVAADVNGQSVPSGFSRVDAFRTGVIGNEDRCFKRFA